MGYKFYVDFKGKNRSITCIHPLKEEEEKTYYFDLAKNYMLKEGFITKEDQLAGILFEHSLEDDDDDE